MYTYIFWIYQIIQMLIIQYAIFVIYFVDTELKFTCSYSILDGHLSAYTWIFPNYDSNNLVVTVS